MPLTLIILPLNIKLMVLYSKVDNIEVKGQGDFLLDIPCRRTGGTGNDSLLL